MLQSDAPKVSTPVQPKYPVRTPRLRLRPVRMLDLAAVNAYRALPDVARYLPHGPHTMADTEATLRSMVAQAALQVPGQWLDLAVELDGSPTVVGEVLLKWNAGDPRQGEIGFVFHPSVQGQGIAREAVGEALRIAFEDFGWHRVEGICDERNERSAALMERLGMRREATFKDADWFKGGWSTLCYFGMLRREWMAAKEPL